VLVLTRRRGEAIEIGDDIVVTVLSTMGGKVRIGIEAPPQVLILRTEVRERGEADDEAA
jgi:carbon storage regulator